MILQSQTRSPATALRLRLKRHASSGQPVSLANAIKYCQDRVRESDYEQYVTTLAIPAHKRRERTCSFALKALNVELANIRDSNTSRTDESTQVMMAKLKIQFWRILVDQVFSHSTLQHPIAVVLAQLPSSSRDKIRLLIDARERNLSVRQYMTLNDIEQYGEDTCSSLMHMHLLGSPPTAHVDRVVSHLGKAQSLVTIMKGVPYLVDKRIFYLPVDVCANHGVTPEHVFRSHHSTELRDAVFQIATRAHDHIITARSVLALNTDDPGVRDILTHAFYALLPVVPTLRWLNRLQKSDFNLFDRHLYQRDPWLPGHLWWANYRRRF